MGYVRRPDVIIVKNPADRWPGRSPVDHQGNPHVDNSLRLVEVKFPGDKWGKDQEQAYQLIAGRDGEQKFRMTVIDVSDCNGDLEKATEQARAMSPAEREAEMRRRQRERRLRAPIRTVEPIADPAWYEEWMSGAKQLGEDVQDAVSPVWNKLQDGIGCVSAEVRAWLETHAPWVATAGKWVVDAAARTWCWVDETGREIYRYTAAQLKAGWDAIVDATDITWEELKKIEWTQIGTSMIKGAAVVVALVAGVAVLFVLAEILVPVLLALGAIVAASAEAMAALATVLGVSAIAGVAAAA